MAQRHLFFNSVQGDRRRYQAQDFAEYFGSVLSTGLLHTDEIPGMSVSVEQGTLNTVVSAGKAIMKGHLYENTTPFTLNHRIPEPDRDRIDRIVLRLDLRQSERNILLHVIEGESSTNPVPPTLQRNQDIYEISLAQIYVHRNTSSLKQTDLTDERLDEEVCGLVYSLISIPKALDDLIELIESKGSVTGIYTGDDELEQVINLGFKPSAVLVFPASLPSGNYLNRVFGLALVDSPASASVLSSIVVEIIPTGFKVFRSATGSAMTNSVNVDYNPYRYIAYK